MIIFRLFRRRLVLSLVLLGGGSGMVMGLAEASSNAAPNLPSPADISTDSRNPLIDERLRALAHRMALRVLDHTDLDDREDEGLNASRDSVGELHVVAHATATLIEDNYFRGRYNRSRARLPENIETWRSQPNISNPGADLANFPNSAFTLPEGRFYVEMSPLTYYGPGQGQPAQFNSEFLLRYGVTDDIELRVFGNGVSWQGGKDSATGFSPIAFDTKIHLFDENEEWFLPAVGFEAYLQTTWLGNEAFDQGTTPGFFMNFDQSLPFDVDFEYNLGATEQLDGTGSYAWQFSFQWALQRDIFNQQLAVFIHGYYNAMTLPRLPQSSEPSPAAIDPVQNAVGGGFIYTPNNRVSFWIQSAGGTTQDSPSVISNLGFAVAF